jgi:hypothetical protein
VTLPARPGRRPPRIPLLALGMLALIGALWGGLARLGWQLPAGFPGPATFHGPLMVSGFLGTVIALERAVAVGGRAPSLVPLVTGLGGLALMLGAPAPLGQLLATLGGAGLCAIFVVIMRRQRELFTATMTLGAVAWLVGNALWLAGWPVYRVVPWWIGFLVLTIAGERLELARFVRVSSASRGVFAVIVGAFVAALALTIADLGLGVRLAGVAMACLSGWLGWQDIARHTVRQPGLPRFTALCLLSGYGWLGVGGLLALGLGGVGAGALYDALLHSIFLGFVMAMIFGHAPIIFPAVLGRSMPFRRRFYAHLALLHASLVLRVAGDLVGWVEGRRWGGLLNVVAVVLFLASTAAALKRGSSMRVDRRVSAPPAARPAPATGDRPREERRVEMYSTTLVHGEPR